jgi:hypothetical protein
MRVILALLAVIGLLLSPVAAAAASSACLHPGDADMSIAMAMPHADAPGKAAADPCCDPGSGKSAPHHDSKRCAQACAAICGVSVALPGEVAIVALTELHARLAPAPSGPIHTHAPPGLKRPPKQDA